MLNKLSLISCMYLYKRNILSYTKKSLFVYGFELFYSTFLSILSIIFLSFLLGDVIFSITFFLGFIPIRFFAGGYHAKTYASCFLSTNLAFLSIVLLSISIRDRYTILLYCIFVLSSFYIFKIAPVKNTNNPIGERVYIKSKRIARKIVFTQFIMITILVFFRLYSSYTKLLILTTSAVSLMIVLVKKRKEGKGHAVNII